MNWHRIKSSLAALAFGLALAAAPAPENPDATCLACHGDKSMGEKYVDAKKFSHSVHGENGCTSCHADVDVKDHPGKPVAPVDCSGCHEKAVASFGLSAHGKARKGGNTGAADCAACHSQHEIVKLSDPKSPVRREHLAQTCGQCHSEVVSDLEASIHGQAAANGVSEAPTCTDCHMDHAIESLKNASPLKIAQEVCSRCHGSSRMNAKFDLPDNRVSTFFDSFHGMSAREGDKKGADCASCHGYHLVLPASDPRSTINKANLVRTCQKCHPSANENFASGTIHQSKGAASDLGGRINNWVRSTYLTLILLTIGGMAAHNLLLHRRKLQAKLKDSNRTFVRMDLAARIQHAVLAISFILLVISGFALKYPHSWLGWVMFNSEVFRRTIHRIAASAMVIGAVIHLSYAIFTRKGRAFVKDMLPEPKDLFDVLAQIRYLLVNGAPRPQFKRFGYAEKAEYWAVVWGTFLMGATGALIWFKLYFTHWMPRWIVDVSITVHYFEAILATLAILVWHFYFVIFDPDTYPLNFAFWDGKVDPHHHKEEHPLDHLGPQDHSDPDEEA
jgi:formate dehydrogenase gamma subunit